MTYGIRTKTKTKQGYIKINKQLPGSSCSSLHVLFSSTVSTLMIDCTWSRVCRSVISWNGGVYSYLAFTRVSVILWWAVSSANTYCITLRRSSNSLSLSQNNPELLTGCWYSGIYTQGSRFVFTFANYCTSTLPVHFPN